MRRSASALIAAIVLASAGTAPAQQKQTPQEKKRQQLLDELGLQRVDKPAPPTPAPAAVPEAEPAPAPSSAASSAKPSAGPAAPPAPSFKRAIHPLLVQSCQVCHRAGGPAAITKLLLTGDAAADYAAVRPFVTPASPLASPLLAKASGQTPHAGGAPWPASGEPHARVLAWISKGAKLDGPAAPPVAAPAIAPAPPRPAPATPRAPAPEALAVPVPEPTVAVAPVVQSAPPAPATPDVHALVTATCAPCHNARGTAAATRLVLTGDAAADDAALRALTVPAAPDSSLLLTKASGELHGGGIVLPPGDPRLAALRAWIASAAPPPSPAAATPPPAVPAPPAVVVVAPPPPPSAHGPHGGLVLPGHFMLNGRFDLAYERRQFNGNPFVDGAVNVLRSYHHFLFLSRESASDPFGLSVEMLTLQFWEAHARLGGGARPWRLVLAGGKIIVPFGADPLTHQSYGGLIGFDQQVLPVIWAQEGAAAHLTVGRGRLLLTDDLFVVRGYGLTRADEVLNLQNDFSPADDVRIGVGNRVGASWQVLSAWYSAYFNSLGFGQRLFMQAADLTIWRPRAIPVLGHFSAAAGLLRADVSGAGSGLDYYHFGSYFQLRYHPTDWLYLQYRQGLRTFNNRRGVVLDETRLTAEDGSTHNFAVVARWRGVTAALAYFLLFEKADEIPNDFLRASVTYDF